MTLSAILVTITSVVLYFAPSRGIARSSGWSSLLLNRDTWLDAHVIFGFGVIGLALYHVYLNRKALAHYIKRTRAQAGGWRREALVAAVVTAGVLAFVLGARGSASTLSNYGKTVANTAVRSQRSNWNGSESSADEGGWRGGRAAGTQEGARGGGRGSGNGRGAGI